MLGQRSSHGCFSIVVSRRPGRCPNMTHSGGASFWQQLGLASEAGALRWLPRAVVRRQHTNHYGSAGSDWQIGLLAEEATTANEWRSGLRAAGVTSGGLESVGDDRWDLLRIAVSLRTSQVGCCCCCCCCFYLFFFAFIWFQLAPGFRVWPKIKEGVWPLLGYD
jgi:hypothetical protein